jgi:hypothetical protein
VNVRLTSDEIIEACIEWVKNNHNLDVDDSEKKPTFALGRDLAGAPRVEGLDLYEATGQPYR